MRTTTAVEWEPKLNNNLNCNTSAKPQACIPARILTLRKRRCWNQRQLADASGLSQRVISKAEAGNTLSSQSIERIALALATDSEPVFPEDLITDQRAKAVTYLQLFSSRQAEMTESIFEHFALNPTFEFSGSEKTIPFAGFHDGINEFDQAIRCFFRMFKTTKELPASDYDIYEKHNQVICWGRIKLGLIDDAELQTVAFGIRFSFARGKISHVESQFDFQAVLGNSKRKLKTLIRR